jgi:hypothetical protein
MTKPSQAELMQLSVSTVEAFVLRARRVVAHSLAEDPETLLSLARGSMTLEYDRATGKQFLTRQMPEEEVLESAAARVRPILLASEPVHWGRTLKALSYLCRGKSDVSGDAFSDLRDIWKRVQPAEGAARAYYVQVQKHSDLDATAATDNELGLAWFYGDVVHADVSRRLSGEAFGINERYRAAGMLVAIAMVSTKMTLNLILKLQAEGVLELSDSIFTEEVTVTDTEGRQEVEAFVGEPGTPLPDGPLGGIPEGFAVFDPDKI